MRTRIACSPAAVVERPRWRRRSGRDSRPALARRQLRAQVDDLDRRQRPDRAPRQHDPVVACPSRARPTLSTAGRRRPEHDRRPRPAGQLDRDVARLEPRRPVALVGGVVLLVDDDRRRRRPAARRPRAACRRRCRRRRPGSGATRRPARRRRGRNGPARSRASRSARSRSTSGQRQRDLRDEHEGRPAGLERRGDGLDVDRGLAAAGHAVEQQRPRVAGLDGRLDPGDGVGLGGRQVGGRWPATAQPGSRRRAAAAGARGPRPRPGRAGPARQRAAPCRVASSAAGNASPTWSRRPAPRAPRPGAVPAAARPDARRRRGRAPRPSPSGSNRIQRS